MQSPWPSTIDDLLDRLGLLPAELAHVLGVSERTVQQWRAGQSRPTTAVEQLINVLWNVTRYRPERVTRFIGASSLQSWVERALREALPAEGD